MAPTISRTSVLLMLTCSVMACSQGSSPPQVSGNPQNPPVRERKIEGANRPYHGRVVAIDDKSITIIQDDSPARKFAWSKTLANGGIGTGFVDDEGLVRVGHPGRGCYFRASDVLFGDIVKIHYSIVDGVETCDDISINSRPKGRVPPSPEATKPIHNWHVEQANAFQDWEEKGIPLPPKFAHMMPENPKIAPSPREMERSIPPALP